MTSTSVAIALSLLLVAPPQPFRAAPEAEAPPSDGDAVTADASPAVSDTTLQAVEGENIEISTGDGASTRGTLEAIGDDVVVVMQSNGALVEVPRASITAVKVLEPASPPTAAATTASVTMCVGDESCDDPRVCIEGECRVPPGYTDELRAEAGPRIKGGRITMIAGAAVAGPGLVILATGFGVYRRTIAERRVDAGFAAGVGGSIIFGVGALTLLTGGGMYGMGKNKLKRAERYDKQLGVSVRASRRGFGIGVSGRF